MGRDRRAPTPPQMEIYVSIRIGGVLFSNV